MGVHRRMCNLLFQHCDCRNGPRVVIQVLQDWCFFDSGAHACTHCQGDTSRGWTRRNGQWHNTAHTHVDTFEQKAINCALDRQRKWHCKVTGSLKDALTFVWVRGWSHRVNHWAAALHSWVTEPNKLSLSHPSWTFSVYLSPCDTKHPSLACVLLFITPACSSDIYFCFCMLHHDFLLPVCAFCITRSCLCRICFFCVLCLDSFPVHLSLFCLSLKEWSLSPCWTLPKEVYFDI